VHLGAKEGNKNATVVKEMGAGGHVQEARSARCKMCRTNTTTVKENKHLLSFSSPIAEQHHIEAITPRFRRTHHEMSENAFVRRTLHNSIQSWRTPFQQKKTRNRPQKT
jgi:hypothetical protein